MKRRVLLAVCCALAAGCGSATEREPNDTPDRAQTLKPNASVHGTISTPADVDVYRMEVSRESGVLSAHVGGIRDIDFILSVLDSSQTEIKRYDETSIGGDEWALDLGVRRGFYFLALSNKNPKANNPSQPYTLEVRVDSDAGSEREPNDSAPAANVIEAGSVVRGHYFPSQNLLAPSAAPAPDAAVLAISSAPLVAAATAQAPAVTAATAAAGAPITAAAAAQDAGEQDWFRIRITEPGIKVLNVDISGVPRIDAVLEIYDVNGYKLKELDAAGVGEPESLRNFGVHGPIDYLLRLKAKSRLTSNAETRYELLTELVAYQGSSELEPNDQRSEATPFEQASLTGAIATIGDQDWYKIVVAQDGRHILGAQLTGLAGMDVVLSLRDELGNVLVTADNAGKDQPEALTGFGVSKGVYYLVVFEKTGRKAHAKQTYTLSKSLAPAQPGLEFELNDSSASAQAIKVGESVDGYCAPKGDVDYYEFNVYQKGRITVEATGVVNVRLGMSLFDQEGRELKSGSGKRQGEGVALVADLEPDTYQLRLRAEDPGQNNVRDKYTLRIKVQ